MNRIELRGVIVPSMYDVEWTRGYIEKGIITPESVFRRAIDKADPATDLTVYINSPGGSVFAAYEMANALNDWKQKTGKQVDVIVGAMAASAASAITIMAADTVSAHSNSKMMFHGAWTETAGGAEAHKDEAGLLEKINADIKDRLINRYKLSQEQVDEWFKEGRAGWLTAEEMVSVGIASGIIDEAAEEIETPQDAYAMIEENGLAIAALLEADTAETEEDHVSDESGTPAKPDSETATDEPDGTVPDAGKQLTEETEKQIKDAVNRRTLEYAQKLNEEKEQRLKSEAKAEDVERSRRETQSKYDKAIAEHEKAIAALAARHKSELETLKTEHETELTNLKSSHEATVNDLTAKRDEAVTQLGKLMLNGLTYSPDVTTWEEALRQCDNDYVTARKRYPDAYSAFMSRKR